MFDYSYSMLSPGYTQLYSTDLSMSNVITFVK